MGQSFSQRMSSRLHRMTQRLDQYMEKEALEEVAEKKRMAKSLTRQPDPNSLLTGFTRGIGLNNDNPNSSYILQKEKAQRDHLLSKTTEDGIQDMPPDLVKFLNSASPVQRSLDKSLTSQRLVSEMKKENLGEQEFFDREDKKERRRRRRRWMDNAEHDEDEAENANSSSVAISESTVGPKPFLLTDEEISALLRDDDDDEVVTNIRKDMTPENKETIDIISKYIAHPVLMLDNDEDQSLVGAWKDNVTKFKGMGLTLHTPGIKKTATMLEQTSPSTSGSSEGVENMPENEKR